MNTSFCSPDGQRPGTSTRVLPAWGRTNDVGHAGMRGHDRKSPRHVPGVRRDDRNPRPRKKWCPGNGPRSRRPFGLDHAEVVLPGVRVQRHEAHAASAHAGDARQVNVTSALAREFDQRLGAQLLGHRRVQPDAFSGCEPVCVGNRVGHRARSTRARSGATARRLARSSLRRDCFVCTRREEKRYPKMPVRVVALEPEQQGGTGPDI